MLNPELREVYSEHIMPTLKIISDFLEERNIVAYAFDKKQCKGIIRPIAIIFDNSEIANEVDTLAYEASKLYLKLLEPEDRDELMDIVAIGRKHVWEKLDGVRIPLWVK